MHRTLTAAVLAAAALLALTACGTTPTPNEPATTASAVTSSAAAAAGIPSAPTAAQRAALIAALTAIAPTLTADEDKAVSNARNQCSTITGGGNAIASAQARFSTNDHQVTAAEAKLINTALQLALCPKS
jgi:hypothetical protein